MGDGFYHAYLFANAELRLTVLCPKQAIFEVRDAKLSTREDPYRVKVVLQRFVCNTLTKSLRKNDAACAAWYSMICTKLRDICRTIYQEQTGLTRPPIATRRS